MSQDETPLNFVFRWKDAEARRDTGSDSVSMAEATEAGRAEGGPDADDLADGAAEAVSGEVADEDLADETFEWSADREQALIDAFEDAPEGAVPRVHQQIEDIARALESHALTKERAATLLGEVEAYLAGKIQAESRKPVVLHEAFTQSRADKSNALAAWQEATTALREYLDSGEAVQLKIAFYAAEQANTFLTSSREVLLASEPEWEDEESEGDEDESGDDDGLDEHEE